MNDMSRDQVEDIVDSAIARATNSFSETVRAELKSFRDEERKFHIDRTNTNLELMTGIKPGEHGKLRNLVDWLFSFRRNYSRIATLISGSFIGLCVKAFWEDITGIFPGG